MFASTARVLLLVSAGLFFLLSSGDTGRSFRVSSGGGGGGKGMAVSLRLLLVVVDMLGRVQPLTSSTNY